MQHFRTIIFNIFQCPPTSNLNKHLRQHKDLYEKYEAESKACKEDNLKRKGGFLALGRSAKQPKITDAFAKPKILSLATALAVNDGLPFKIFDSPHMRNIIDFAKSGAGEAGAVVNAENVKLSVSGEAAELREKIKKQLKGKVISITADYATAERRSFIGRPRKIK